ncbi:hypothetical protein P6U21_30195, partial [Bacillus paranthracis]|nr:hypothetical protein [Bacillus paranthracis]
LSSKPDGRATAHRAHVVRGSPQLESQLFNLLSQEIEICRARVKLSKSVSVCRSGVEEIVEGSGARPQQPLNSRQTTPQFLKPLRISFSPSRMASDRSSEVSEVIRHLAGALSQLSSVRISIPSAIQLMYGLFQQSKRTRLRTGRRLYPIEQDISLVQGFPDR